MAGPASAQVLSFKVPAQSAASGITQFAHQASVQILVSADAARGQRTAPVFGPLTVPAALEHLLAGTNLTVVSNAGGTITLGPRKVGLQKTAWTVASLAPDPPMAAPPATPESAADAAPQPAAALAPSPTKVQEVVVTGSHLQTQGFKTPTPVTVIGGAQIQERSAATVFEVLRDIPSFNGSSGPSVNSTGAQNASKANLNLRGLGSVRTLVLVDGMRHVGDSQTGVFDTNLLPTSLIDRIDVVTGGASAAYGSDAVAGVVNFVLKTHMEGFNANVQYGESQHGDDIEPTVSLAYGTSLLDGRAHFIIGGDLTHNKGTGLMYSRDWGQLEPGVLNLATTRAAGLPATIIANHVETSSYNSDGLITSGPLKGTAFTAAGQPTPFQYGSLVGPVTMIGTGNYGSVQNPDQRLAAPYDRAALLSRFEYDLDNTTTAFAQVQYGALRTFGQSFGAAVPLFNNYPVLAGNPFIPASVQQAMATDGLSSFNYSASRHDDVGSIRSRNNTESLQLNFGVKGEVFGDWKWDIGGGAGRANFRPLLQGTPRTADLYESAYVVTGANGQPACGNPATNPYFNAQTPVVKARLLANLSPNCVPYNIFGNDQAANQAAINYFDSASEQNNHFGQYTVAANLAGSPISLPAGPLAVATGFAWREETARVIGCPDCQKLELLNQNYSTYRGSIDVEEVYGELGAPLVRDLPLLKSVDLNAAVRETNYSTSGAVTTWKIGGTWDLNDTIRFRVTQSRDIRAPNINELYNPGSEGNPTVINKVTGASGFIKSNTVGNPDLTPETADTFTGGVILQPKWDWASGFRASVDYYHINIKNVISTLAVQDVLDAVLVNKNQSLAKYVTLDPNNPVGVTAVNTPELNLNAMIEEGIDIELDYKVPLYRTPIPGSLNIRALGNWTDEIRTITPTTNINYADVTQPEWSWNLLFLYNVRRFNAGLTVRYTGDIKYSATLVGPDKSYYNPASANSVNRNVWPSAIYFDPTVSYDLPMWGRKAQVYLTINNLLDKDPPIVAISINGSPYDLIGRAFKTGLRVNF